MHTEQEKIEAMGVMAVLAIALNAISETVKHQSALTEDEVKIIGSSLVSIAEVCDRLEGVVRGSDK